MYRQNNPLGEPQVGGVEDFAASQAWNWDILGVRIFLFKKGQAVQLQMCVMLTASKQWLHQGLPQLSNSVTLFWGWRLSDWTRQWHRDRLFPPTVQSLCRLVVALELSAGHHRVSTPVWGLPLVHFCLHPPPFPFGTSIQSPFSLLREPSHHKGDMFKSPKEAWGKKEERNRARMKMKLASHEMKWDKSNIIFFLVISSQLLQALIKRYTRDKRGDNVYRNQKIRMLGNSCQWVGLDG